MKKIVVNNLKPGVAYSKPLYLDEENVFLKANEKVTQSDIDRLSKWNISYLLTDGEVVKNAPKTSFSDENFLDGSSGEQEKSSKEIISNLKATHKNKNAFHSFILEAENQLNEAYNEIYEEKPYQISLIRNLAERLTDQLNNCPYCFMPICFPNESSSIVRHVIIASLYGAMLANAIGYSKPRISELVMGMLLMDIGMKEIPEGIIFKKEALTDSDKIKLQRHPLTGYRLLTQVAKVKNSIAIIALEHQEHYDGTGYPRSIKADKMSEYSKIASIADSYAAIIEKKPYKKAKLPYEAMKELLSLGIYRYDPKFLKAFLGALSIYPIGSIVELSDASVGIIVGSVKEKPMRPVILTMRDESKNRTSKPRLIHLLHQSDKYILKAYSAEDLGIMLETEFSALIKELS